MRDKINMMQAMGPRSIKDIEVKTQSIGNDSPNSLANLAIGTVKKRKSKKVILKQNGLNQSNIIKEE